MDIKKRGMKFWDWMKALRAGVLLGFYGTVFVALLVLLATINNVWVEVILHHGS
jgi:hypothetical protein